MRPAPALLLACLLPAATAFAQPPKFSDQQLAFFESRVRPILIDHCSECHSGDEPESGLSVESREGLLAGGELGPAILPGDPQQSLLIRAVRHDEFLKMPPKRKLATSQVATLAEWVKMDAPWPGASSATSRPAGASRADGDEGPLFSQQQQSFWAFQPLAAPAPPSPGDSAGGDAAAGDSAWIRGPIDAFVLERLRQQGLSPAPPADRRDFIRRATFDLLGLPPTPAEIEAFVEDRSPQAEARLIDRLLASPRYGERWGRHWLDVARYADSNGLDENLSYAHAFRYRDYVIASFNRDKPYGRFVREQLAGDLLPEGPDEAADLERLVATGFWALGPKMLAEDDPVKMQMDIIDEQLSTMGQALLGLTIGCARCHDHKFDPLPTADYYSLAGILKSTTTMENHKVVAVWYERPLVTDERARRIEVWEDASRQAKAERAELTRRARGEIARRRRALVAESLLAARAADAFRRQLDALPRRPAQSKQPAPLKVDGGYALLEAEAFHRGNVEVDTSGYGKGIGVLLTRGPAHAEYDLEVERGGAYALEVRYAAAAARPVTLVVNGQRVSESVAGDVTGSWNPDTQRWSAEARLTLKPGRNTLRLESQNVYPHLDRLALVLAEPQWPFPGEPPLSITRQAPVAVDARLVTAWQQYLKQLASAESDADAQPRAVLLPWLELSQVEPGRFADRLESLLEESNGAADTPSIAEPLRKQLLDERPRSIEELAAAYQRLIDKAPGAADAGDKQARAPWAAVVELLESDRSPLSGPAKIADGEFPESLREPLVELQQREKQLGETKPSYPVAMGVTEAAPEDLRIHLRGSHLTLGEVAPRRMPRILAGEHQPPIADGASGRLELAHWITSEDNPLLYRVIANRVWRWHFGRGLVATVDNFGALGQPPSHAELLDWLALQLVRGGGSIKRLHRQIMLSSTYRMSTRFDERAYSVDPENRLLWRMPRRRLSGEEVRDAMLQLGAGLDLTMGGSLLKVANRAYVTNANTNITDEFDNHRRSVYLPVVRSSVYELLQTLDFPDPAVSNGDRATTTVAPQALLMMNSALVSESTDRLAARLLDLPPQQRMDAAYRQVLGRRPTVEEAQSAESFLRRAAQLAAPSEAAPSDTATDEAERTAWASLARVLMSSNEFFYVE